LTTGKRKPRSNQISHSQQPQTRENANEDANVREEVHTAVSGGNCEQGGEESNVLVTRRKLSFDHALGRTAMERTH